MGELAIIWRFALYAILIAAAIGDIRRFEIPNAYPIAVLVLLIFALAFSWQGALSGLAADIAFRILGGLIAFIVGLALFVTRIMGGGDVKLFSALGFWYGAEGLLSLFSFVAFAGFFTGIGAAIVFMLREGPKGAGRLGQDFATDSPELAPLWRRALRARVPYGVAICIGAIAAGEFGFTVAI